MSVISYQKIKISSSKGFKDLEVWRKSMLFVKNIYGLTSAFPREEMYGLTTQIRRAAISVPSNIAEGASRRNPGDFSRFIDIAYGSLAEVETQLILSEMLSYITNEQLNSFSNDVSDIGKMLNGIKNHLEKQKTDNS